MIMTPDHPRWGEFQRQLGKTIGQGLQAIHNCRGNFNKTKFLLPLFGLKPAEVLETLWFFEESGGHCDCEVLLNVR